MNIAILIGIANYEAPALSALPACLRDVEAMRELVGATKRFDEIIPLKDVSSTVVFDELKKLSEHKALNEVFIYFSGHGYAESNDFFWAARDFSEASPNTTGVARSALFEVIRNVKTDNVVIVQDACFSGRDIIKGSIAEPEKSIGNFLIFSSSLAHETTPSGVTLSPYTDMFIEAASHAKSEGKVDYLDILRMLRDLFRDNKNNSPHLASQGPVSVTFCEDASYLSEIRAQYDIARKNLEESTETLPSLSDEELLVKAEKLLTSQQKAQEVINLCGKKYIALLNKQADLQKFFKSRIVSHSDYSQVTEEEEIVRSIQSSGRWDDFVTAKVVREKVRHPRALWASTILESMYAPEYRNEYVFEISARLDGAHQLFFLEPVPRVLERHALEVVFVPGIFECIVFWRFLAQGLADWEKFSDQGEKSDWQARTTDWDDLTSLIGDELFPSLFDRASTALENTISNLRKLVDEREA